MDAPYKPKEHVIHTLKCERCGKKFPAGRKDARYCSQKCNFSSWYEANPRVRRKEMAEA